MIVNEDPKKIRVTKVTKGDYYSKLEIENNTRNLSVYCKNDVITEPGTYLVSWYWKRKQMIVEKV